MFSHILSNLIHVNTEENIVVSHFSRVDIFKKTRNFTEQMVLHGAPDCYNRPAPLKFTQPLQDLTCHDGGQLLSSGT
ncbi:hypothetical protein SprV_0200713200 [Sparganum proliferum]